jgi:DNA modification methylase
MSVRIIVGDVREKLRELPDESVHCCVTSPPYFGLRDYGDVGQIGLEPTPDAYVAELVAVFREVRRVLRKDGTLWLNLGDSYAGSGRGLYADGELHGTDGVKQRSNKGSVGIGFTSKIHAVTKGAGDERVAPGLKSKDLVGIPWRVAFALQADGWYLRSDIIWAKPNPMPESIRDRPTRSHEYLFLLTKSARYYYDHEAIKEPLAASSIQRINQPTFDDQTGGEKDYRNGTNPSRSACKALENFAERNRRDDTGRDPDKRDARRTAPPPPPEKGWLTENVAAGRNKRDVWTIPTKPFKGAHFAVFPPALVEPCVLAGSPTGGTVLDPFAGSGTTGMVAKQHGRNSVLIELNREYVPLIKQRLASLDVQPKAPRKPRQPVLEKI